MTDSYNDNFTYDVPSNLDDARNNLRIAKEQFDRSPTYHAARAIQIAQKHFDNLVLEARNTFFVFDGDKGFHTVTPYEIAVSALQEIVSRGKELTELYKGIDFAPTTYVNYFTNVADQALRDSGNSSTVPEITIIKLDDDVIWDDRQES